jgi:hypothetical protein
MMRGCASSRFTSASVAALTCVSVMLRDRVCFVFVMVQVYASLIEGAMVRVEVIRRSAAQKGRVARVSAIELPAAPSFGRRGAQRVGIFTCLSLPPASS